MLYFMTLLLTGLFVVGYVLITLEHSIKINKTATALITGVVCWAAYALLDTNTEAIGHQLGHHLTDTAEILRYARAARSAEGFADYMANALMEPA